MNIRLLRTSLANPTLLFIIPGIVASAAKSDLEIPAATIKFRSRYLLFSIGFCQGRARALAPF